MDKNQPRWTEIEHLPEWDEEFYDVYTAKKFGKWVMLKTLKPDLRDKPEMQEMLEKEFDVRYNLAHPNIIMINDLEDVPGVGRCIITDDVYGTFAKDFLLDMSDAGSQVHFNAMRKLASEHPAEVVGEEIRKLYSWSDEDKLINN